MNTIIKCPQCGGIGHKYLFEYRYYYHCVECGLNCLLKIIQQMVKGQNDEK
jgi:hypothetical protein